MLIASDKLLLQTLELPHVNVCVCVLDTDVAEDFEVVHGFVILYSFIVTFLSFYIDIDRLRHYIYKNMYIYI